MSEEFNPFPYQPAMVDWCVENPSSALFVSPGKGKTVCTLAALDRLMQSGESRGALIIAPLRVCSITWPNQVERWNHSKRFRVAHLRTKQGMQAWHDCSADIYLINSEQLIAKAPILFNGKVLPVDTLIIDELSLAKNPTSKRFKMLRKYLPMFKQRIGLTGTPVPNNYLDLYGQIRLLDDGKRLGKSFSEYKNKFFYPADYMGYTFKLGPGAKEEIDALLSDLCLVIIGDESDLPASSVVDVPVTLPTDARKAYRTLEKELLIEIKDKEVVALTAATLCNKLLQITGGAVYDDEKAVVPIHTAKIEALRKIRKQHKDEPILVLTAFKHESARILAEIEGAEMFDERRLQDWQDGKIKTWVADPRSLSHGIDGLQKSGRIAVWFTLTYSNETYIQTNARLIRTGQSAETLIYRLIATNTIDDAVAEALREKTNTQSGLMSALKALQTMQY
jgi:superfamily II DNA or RNA helicase